jgi:hypothetical protein
VVQVAVGSRVWGIAVDPANQWVYWTEYVAGRLPRTDYFGAGFVNIQTGLGNPTYLARDASANTLYWTEGAVGAQRIRRSNANGSGMVTLPPPIATYGGIAVGPGETSAIDGIEAGVAVREFALDRPWPNPGVGRVTMAISLPRGTQVQLCVFDVRGRRVAVLANGEMPAGRHEITWDGRARGAAVPAGIYFSRLSAGGRTWVQRFAMTR